MIGATVCWTVGGWPPGLRMWRRPCLRGARFRRAMPGALGQSGPWGAVVVWAARPAPSCGTSVTTP
eukprot:4914964-Lingulodinium_polyedra.AAC.1